jgi:hypothetical protein
MSILTKRWSSSLWLLAFIAAPVIAGSSWTSLSKPQGPASASAVDHYKVLATNKTSTMEKELNEAGEAGYRFVTVMGGETGFGGSEVVVVMVRKADSPSDARFEYRLLATNKTSTMQKELQEAAEAGYDYKGQTVFSSSFGGEEVVLIGERQPGAPPRRVLFRLLATNKTSTMQKELQEAAEDGFEVVGLTVGSTAYGGAELVTVLRRERSP